MVLFKILLCVLVTCMTESCVPPCCSYEFNVVSMQREKHSVFIPQPRMKYTLAKTKSLLRGVFFVYHFLVYICLYVIFIISNIYS